MEAEEILEYLFLTRTFVVRIRNARLFICSENAGNPSKRGRSSAVAPLSRGSSLSSSSSPPRRNRPFPPLSSMSPVAVSSPSPLNDFLPTVPTDNAPSDTPAKISAYYSLVFPNITFFLQTLTVTIGRRCLPPTSASLNGTDAPTPAQSPVDVDLGPLKSVSRLHAKIEYEEEEGRFVLVVIGRNGAWVDGVWSGAGSRVPLGERCVSFHLLPLPVPSCCSRSQIQIASRTFHFVLPPPAAVEDSPSPSSVSSVHRARSPSVDITSISPPSSLPSHSPSPRTAPSLPPPKPPCSPDPQLPNSNAIPRTKAPSASTTTPPSTSTAPTSKKRKKPFNPPPKPDVMPPKPPFTYAQLCYRAIKTMGGKATLQDICGWMMDNHEWYHYNEGAGWEVRSTLLRNSHTTSTLLRHFFLCSRVIRILLFSMN